MKTLKIFALLCLLLGFASKANAQTVVTKNVDYNAFFWIDCVNELATGTANFHLMLHFDKAGNLIRWQQLVTGAFTGVTSGTIYSLKGIWQDNLQLETSQGANTDNSQIIYRLVGQSGPNKQLNVLFHGLWHVTVTPDGEWHLVIWKGTINCE